MRVGNLTIKKGYFYRAGSVKIFNWEKDGLHIYGVGIDSNLLTSYDALLITICGKRYCIDTKEAIAFASHYNSFKVTKGTRLAVISKSLLSNA